MFPVNSKILIVDDMTSIRDLVFRELKSQGYSDIIIAKDGLEAWNILCQQYKNGHPVDLVISDWNMPFMQGIELLKKVKETPEFKTMPFVLLTSESEKDQVTEAVLMGVSQYILKPFSPKSLVDKLKSAWTKHQHKAS